jgi:CBS domain-containing protein
VSPRSVADPLVRDAPVLRDDDRVADAARQVLDSGLPALPVVDASGALRGIFGEREFMGALFPGYLKELKYAGFVPRSLEDALQKRAGCRAEPVRQYMNTEHIDVGATSRTRRSPRSFSTTAYSSCPSSRSARSSA